MLNTSENEDEIVLNLGAKKGSCRASGFQFGEKEDEALMEMWCTVWERRR